MLAQDQPTTAKATTASLTDAPIPASIRSIEQARAFLAEFDPQVLAKFEGADSYSYTYTECCTRCGGSGIYSQYHGVCWDCGGRPTKRQVKRTVMLLDTARSKAKGLRKARKQQAQESARRLEREREAAAILGADEALAAALECEHRICRDLKAKLLHWGSLTEAQRELAIKVAADEANKPAQVEAPEGRIEFEGEVISAKHRETMYGDTLKLTIKVQADGGEWLAWGTCPAALLDGDSWRVRLTKGCAV